MGTEENTTVQEIDWWTHDRVLKRVDFPRRTFASMEEIYDTNKPNVEKLKEIFKLEGRLKKDVIIRILSEANEILTSEPNLLELGEPITICGDIHGQYYDLVRLFEIGGDPATTTYLFLGDYVDRGYYSCECVLLLCAYKINFPKTFFMLRGNHECRHLTQYFTFMNECKVKYDLDIYNEFCDSFNCLPLAAVVNRQFFCVHGGLSPEITSPSDILKINRFQEPPAHGVICDLLWSDPAENYGSEETKENFIHNSVRGCSYRYTYAACCSFLKANNLLSVIRAHEAQDTGYRMYRKSTFTKFPSLITIFSAPNYLDMYNNGAAVLRYEHNLLNIRQFKQSKHPYWLPNMMNAFTWSVPFVAEKIMDVMESVLKICDEEELESADISDIPQQLESKQNAMRNKVLAIGRMSRIFGALRQETESAIKLNGLTPNNSRQTDFVSEGNESVPDALNKILSGQNMDDKFNQVKLVDQINEKLPPGLSDGDEIIKDVSE